MNLNEVKYFHFLTFINHLLASFSHSFDAGFMRCDLSLK